jgi:phosphoribosylanthranilate isomerase
LSNRVHVKICGITNLEDALAAVEAGANALGFVFYKKSPRYISPKKAARIIYCLPPFVNAVGLFVDEELEDVINVMKQVPLTCLQFHGAEPPAYCRLFSGYAYNELIRDYSNSNYSGDFSNVYARYSHGSNFLFKPPHSKKMHPWFKNGWGIPWIKALAVRRGLDLDRAIRAFTFSGARGILLDAWHPDLKGGTGVSFDWNLFPSREEFERNSLSGLPVQLILAGGLTSQNVTEAIEVTKTASVDVSGGVERIDLVTRERLKGLKDPFEMKRFIEAVDAVRLRKISYGS